MLLALSGEERHDGKVSQSVGQSVSKDWPPSSRREPFRLESFGEEEGSRHSLLRGVGRYSRTRGP